MGGKTIAMTAFRSAGTMGVRPILSIYPQRLSAFLCAWQLRRVWLAQRLNAE
jgi:hypothetical protein